MAQIEYDPCEICGNKRYRCEYRTYHLFDKQARKKCAEELKEMVY